MINDTATHVAGVLTITHLRIEILEHEGAPACVFHRDREATRIGLRANPSVLIVVPTSRIQGLTDIPALQMIALALHIEGDANLRRVRAAGRGPGP